MKANKNIKKSTLAEKIRNDLHFKKFKYSTISYPFKEELETLLGVKLSQLHHFLGNFDLLTKGQPILVHKIFYANFPNKIKNIYQNLIRAEISKIVPYPFYYQKIPTLRVGLPGNIFVGSFHKDSDFNHQSYEVNFNLGLANYRSGEFHVEEKPNSNKFKHLDCPYGEILSFDHINCEHGSKPNNDKETMVSFDFRIALKENYFSTEKGSMGNQTKLIIGEYFSSEIINY
ncbi:hypothetical protein [Prochlorococcus sp. MIT 0916]|uniref:hypothetical protein n=1 Tax=Prochlorococcus sp. MIT 0916 TaxID=3082521 RepID=UPI0039B6AAAC